ncbi:MAG: hypothetical protein IJ109_02650 [Firmicutes bacterium]|nr:hypothetical protein [Bacillota bacterium]
MMKHRGRRKRRKCPAHSMLCLLLLAGLIGAAPAFAEDAEENGPVMEVIVGENGAVDGHREDYTERMAPGEDITLQLQGDDGFVIGEVRINDVPLEEEDLEGIAGERSAGLWLEGIDSSLRVEVSFEQDETGGDEGDVTESADVPAAAETAEDGDAPEEPEKGPAEAEPVGTEEPASEEKTTGEENTAAEETPGQTPEQGSGEAEEASEEPEELSQAAADDSPKTGDPLSVIAVQLFLASATMIGIIAAAGLRRKHRRIRS